MLLRRFLFNVALSVLVTGSAIAFPKGTQLPIPELVKAARYSLTQTELSEDTQVVGFDGNGDEYTSDVLSFWDDNGSTHSN